MTSVPRPIAVRPGGMADLIMLQPALARLQRSYGVAPLLVSSEGWAHQILEDQPAVGEVELLRQERLPLWLNPAQKALVKVLKQSGPAPVYIFGGGDRIRLLFEQAGYSRRDVIDSRQYPRGPREHQVAYGLRVAAEFPPAWDDVFCADGPLRDIPAPLLNVTDRLRRDSLSWLTGKQWDDRPLILIQPGTQLSFEEDEHVQRRNCTWPERHWAAVIDALAVEAEGARFLLCGCSEDIPFHRSILELCRYRRVASVASELTSVRLMGLLEHAHSMVSVNAGPAHAAAAVNCPLVAVFGYSDPARQRPLRRQAPLEIATTQGLDWEAWSPGLLEPEQVVEAWRALLPRAPWPASGNTRRRSALY